MNIICFGDSNTWGYDPRGYFCEQYDKPWPELLKEKMQCNIFNWGENGREIPKHALVFPTNAETVIIMLGTNELLQGMTPESIGKKMKEFLKSLVIDREKILLVAPPPMKLGEWVPTQRLMDASIQLTQVYQVLAKDLGVRFVNAGKWKIPLSYDGVHFTDAGHKAFSDELCKDLTNMLITTAAGQTSPDTEE